MTSELLKSRGAGTAKRLQALATSSDAWTPEVRAAAARLMRYWRAVANVQHAAGSDSCPLLPDSASQELFLSASENHEHSEDGRNGTRGAGRKREGGGGCVEVGLYKENAGKDKAKGKGKKDVEGIVESTFEVSSRQHTRRRGSGGKSDRGDKAVDSKDQQITQQPPTSAPSRPLTPPPPARPRLVPLPLWERLEREFNPSQLRAVWAAAASALETRVERERERLAMLVRGPNDSNDSGRVGGGGGGTSTRAGAEGGVILLQGPPGTGKTRTVLGVVSAILARQKETPGGGAAADGGNGGKGMTLEVGRRQKRPGVAGRWAAAKTHQRVS